MGKRVEKHRLEKSKIYLGKPRKLLRFILKLALIEVAITPILGCDPLGTDFDETQAAIGYESFQSKSPARKSGDLKIMTWNVKFAGGRIDFFFDCHGDRVHMTEDEVRKNLDRLAEKIRAYDPDILLLQEVDTDSKRTAHIDMLQYLLDHSDLNYAAYASQWKVDFVPSYGLGQVNSGNAILSKWKLRNSTRQSLPLIEEQDALTQYFWLQRNLLVSEVLTPDGPLMVVNVHTSAFSKDGTKQKQIDTFKSYLDSLDASGKSFVAGGDLNALPPGSKKTSRFPDSVCPKGDFDADDYSKEQTWMASLYDTYQSAISLEDFQNDNTPYFTHTTNKKEFWNRKLDYLFTNESFRSGLVHQDKISGGFETMKLSDHAPITVNLRLNK